MNARIIKVTTVKGVFSYPIGIAFFRRPVGDYPKTVLVSTVQLDGGHLEDQLGIVDAETGYESAVFLAGYGTCGPIHVTHYKTRTAAKAGHTEIIKQLLAGTLALAIPVQYNAWDTTEGDQTEHAEIVRRDAAKR